MSNQVRGRAVRQTRHERRANGQRARVQRTCLVERAPLIGSVALLLDRLVPLVRIIGGEWLDALRVSREFGVVWLQLRGGGEVVCGARRVA